MVHKALGNRVFAFLLSLSEVNDNMREKHFSFIESIVPMLDFRRLIYRDLINNPYPRQDGITPEGRRRNRNKHAHGGILIKITTGKKSTARKPSDKNQNIPSTTVPAVFN